MITVPDAEMRRQVGNTLIIGGTTRRFRLSQRVPCGGSPKSVVASLGFVDSRGRSHKVSATGAY
jgi:hypothetical protein